jgi:hypothetical protein
MTRFLILIGLITLITQTIWAQEVKFSPKVETIFPFYLGASAELHINDQFEFGLGLGFAPGLYVSTVGTVAAELGGNPAYADITEDALQNNLVFRATSKMRFAEHWFVGLALTRLSVAGVSDIQTVGAVATGLDFSGLAALLQAAGRSTDMNLSGQAFAIDATIGRNFELSPVATLQAYTGLIKVISAGVQMSSQLPNFDASQVGSTLLRSSEDEVENILLQYGFSPVLGLSVFFHF